MPAFPFVERLMAVLVLCAQARFGLLGLKDHAFPRIKLFKKHQDTAKPVEYGGAMKDSNELLKWTVEQTGVFVGVKVSSAQVLVRLRGHPGGGARELCYAYATF